MTTGKSKRLTNQEVVMPREEFVQLRLSSDKKEFWKKAAKKEGKTMTKFVADAVDAHLLGENVKDIIQETLSKWLNENKK